MNTLYIEMSVKVVVRKGCSRTEMEVRHELVAPLLHRLLRLKKVIL